MLLIDIIRVYRQRFAKLISRNQLEYLHFIIATKKTISYLEQGCVLGYAFIIIIYWLLILSWIYLIKGLKLFVNIINR